MATLRVAPEPAVAKNEGFADFQAREEIGRGSGARFRRDVPTAQVHVLDAGHFALDTSADDIGDLV